MTIVWSKSAEKNYLKVQEYLTKHWTKKEILRLENRLNRLLQNVISFKTICPNSKKINLHKCVVDENNSLVYRMSKNQLTIIDFIPHKRNITKY